MFVRLRKPNVLKNVVRKYVNAALDKTNGITNEASATATVDSVEYPPLFDTTYEGRIRRRREMWHEKIRKIETVEEKIIGLNMPRYYGWKSLYLEEGIVRYNSLQQAQQITRTHIASRDELPSYYTTIITDEQLNHTIELVKNHIENAIVFEYCDRLRKQEIEVDTNQSKIKLQNDITNQLIYQINRILLSALSPILPYLLHSQVDFEPRMEAFWFAGGIPPGPIMRKAKANLKSFKGDPDALINIPVQYVGSPIIRLRHKLPLKEIVPLEECCNPELDVPRFEFDPRVLGYNFSHKHATSIPGFWPGDPAEFGLLSYHNTNSLSTVDIDDAHATQAIFASYSWLLSLAYYQGFTTVNDITYPLTCQTILTNGQEWSFCVYQLNTTLVHSEYVFENPKRNMCWMTKRMKLFDKVEEGKVHGLNEDVLKKLIQFYVNMPEERPDINMKPLLGETVKRIADIKDPARRTWLEKHFKHLVTNRPRHIPIPEIYSWQKLFLIDRDTKIVKRRDPWQFGLKPSKRRLDCHGPVYIPKCLRENPKKKKIGRFEKTYYPDA